ncbi:hypothetical protein K439DRAFT_1612005 [Ramaria rubella]|nr:hypothetical protein K439DRAFT_1612005 [Ramaria rubella]
MHQWLCLIRSFIQPFLIFRHVLISEGFDRCLIQCKGMNVYDAKEGDKMLIDKNRMAWYWYQVQSDQGNDVTEGNKTVIVKALQGNDANQGNKTVIQTGQRDAPVEI